MFCPRLGSSCDAENTHTHEEKPQNLKKKKKGALRHPCVSNVHARTQHHSKVCLSAGPPSQSLFTALANQAQKTAPKIRVPQYRPQYTIVLIIGTPKEVPLIWGNPHIPTLNPRCFQTSFPGLLGRSLD